MENSLLGKKKKKFLHMFNFAGEEGKNLQSGDPNFSEIPFKMI